MTFYDSTIGAAFVGYTVAAMFYGILSMQMYTYFQRYSLDRPFYRAMVVAVWILETLHSALTGHVVYHYAITNYANPLALLVPTWSIVIQVLVGALISILVKSAFAMRVWRFSGNSYVLTGFIGLLNIAIFVLTIIFVIKGFQIKTFVEISRIKWITSSILAISVFTDIVIATSLTYFLHHLRNAFSANTLVNGLIRYSIETGAITSMCGIATLIAFNMLPSSFVYLSFFFVLSKLYSNSLLATLNTRRVVRGRGTDQEQGTHGDFTIIQGAVSGQLQTNHSIFGPVDWSKRPHEIEISVQKEIISVGSVNETQDRETQHELNKTSRLSLSKLQFHRPTAGFEQDQNQEYELAVSTPSTALTETETVVPPDYALSSLSSGNTYTRGNEVYAYGAQPRPESSTPMRF